MFLQNDSFVKLAIEQLSAVLKAGGHECELFIESGEKHFLRAALSSGADLFAFSCTTGGEKWVLKIAAEIKKQSKVPVIVGGPHTTFFPKLIEDKNIDYICRGEGEYALLDLLDAIKNNPGGVHEISNIWSKDTTGKVFETEPRDFIEDLDELPAPDFDLYTKYRYMHNYNLGMFPVITGRGCPYNCNYCFNRSYKELYKGKGKYLRRRSPENVIQELLYAKEKYGIRQINFVDDSFFMFPDWLRKFNGLYKEKINLPFIINVEATQVKEEFVRIIKDMGCICVRMGVESGNEQLRQVVLNKKITNQQIKKAAGHIKRYGIKLSTFNIFGLPGETLENALETLNLNKEIHADLSWCSLLQPYPGTELAKIIKEKGLLLDENDKPAMSESYFVSSNIKLENPREITNLQKLMQSFIQLHIPLFLVKKIIALPSNPLFHVLFKLSFIYGKLRVQKIRLLPTFMLGLHSLSYMNDKNTE